MFWGELERGGRNSGAARPPQAGPRASLAAFGVAERGCARPLPLLRVFGRRRARRSGEGCPEGSPAGRQTRWGKAGAPQRRGLPGVKRRVSTSQAEAAPAAGQHESSGGAPAAGQHEYGGGVPGPCPFCRSFGGRDGQMMGSSPERRAFSFSSRERYFCCHGSDCGGR